MRHRPPRGFALAWMLVLVALIALAGGSAAQDVLFAQQLAGTRQLEQRAMGMAELGLRIGMQQLSGAASPRLDTGILHPGASQADAVQVQLHAGATRLPDEYSAGLFVERDYEIQSTARTARNTRRTLVQGVSRLEPVAGGP